MQSTHFEIWNPSKSTTGSPTIRRIDQKSPEMGHLHVGVRMLSLTHGAFNTNAVGLSTSSQIMDIPINAVDVVFVGFRSYLYQHLTRAVNH